MEIPTWKLITSCDFVTQIEAEEEVAQVHCSFLKEVETQYEEYRNAVFVNKTRLLADKISKFNLKPVDFVKLAENNLPSKKALKKNEKMSRQAMKALVIAKDKSDNLEYVFSMT